MLRTVQEAFERFELEHVRVPDAQNRQAKRVQQEFREAISEQLGGRHSGSFLAGSYARRTQSVYLKDLDIVVVLNDPTGELRSNASGTLALMKRTARALTMVVEAEAKCRAVECVLDGCPFWVDLVPALEDGSGGLLLAFVDAERGVDEWRPADPRGQIEACRQKNAQADGDYVPVTRVGKFWNSSFVSNPNQKKPMPSYLVEAILFDAMSGPGDWADHVLAFFENAYRHLSVSYPSVPCPGASTDFVDEMLEPERRIRALGKVELALSQARIAAAEPHPGKAMDAWAKVFGSAFPAPSTHPALIAAALRSSVATVSGTSVTALPTGRRPIAARSHCRVRPVD